MEQKTLGNKCLENFKYFLTILKNSRWALTASEETVDRIFKCALEIEEMFLQKEKSCIIEEILETYSNLSLKKAVDVLMQNILQNHNLDKNLTLYAIKKYTLLSSKSHFSKLLDRIFSEIRLREQIFKLIEEFPDVDLDFYRLNKFLCDLLNSSDLKCEILNNLKTQSSVFLKAVKHSLVQNKQIILEEAVACLESQTDLRLWFFLMRDENLDIVLYLCAEHKNFFNAVLRFFDKFATETESNYDEELNIIYSHVNLDFGDFVKILQLFLKQKTLRKAVIDYLESKTLTDKNFCFWVDVKACLDI